MAFYALYKIIKLLQIGDGALHCLISVQFLSKLREFLLALSLIVFRVFELIFKSLPFTGV